MKIRTRIASGLGAAALILAPAIALAPGASAAACLDGEDTDCNVVIEGEDGFEGIQTLGATISGGLGTETPDPDFVTTFQISHDEDGNLVCLNADGSEMEMSVMTDNCELDRSGLARGEDGTDVTPVEGDEIETGDGYQNIVPINADITADSGSNTGWIIGGIAAAVVVAGGAAFVGLRLKSGVEA